MNSYVQRLKCKTPKYTNMTQKQHMLPNKLVMSRIGNQGTIFGELDHAIVHIGVTDREKQYCESKAGALTCTDTYADVLQLT